MAATREAARLTETHRLAQARLGQISVRQVRSLWPLLDPDALDATFSRWLRTITPIVQAQRSASSQLAARYVSTFRTLELGLDAEPFVPALEGPASARALTTSMLVTGPVSIKSAIGRGIPVARAVEVAEARSARAAMRHVLDGGRQTIISSINADPNALGWARATSGKPCHFCAMLASRGAVYKSAARADFRPHDGCSCAPEALYRRDADLPPGSDEYARLWHESTRGLSGGDAINAFRKALG